MSAREFSSLKLKDWPALDQKLWLEARLGEDPLDEQGLAAFWKPSTVVHVEYAYGAFLWWLKTTGQLDPLTPPKDRLTPKMLSVYIDIYRVDHASHTLANNVLALANMLRVMHPDEEFQWIYDKVKNFKRKVVLTKTNAERLLPLGDLISLSDRLMAKGRSELAKTPIKGAMHYRDGLIIAFLIAFPLRRYNLNGLRLGKTLHRDTNGLHAAIDKSNVKNNIDANSSYPPRLVAAFDFYWSDVRPHFVGKSSTPDTGWVWLGRRGEHMGDSNLAVITRRCTGHHLGKALGTHAFRHCVASEIAIRAPASVGITKVILGHTNDSTSAKYYDLSSSVTASNAYQALLAVERAQDAKYFKKRNVQEG